MGNSYQGGNAYIPGSSSVPAVTGATRANTNHWRSARGNVQAGVKNGRILCVGNSITAGFDSTGVSTTNQSAKSYPTQMSQILTSQGLNSSWQSWCGGQNITDFNFQDNRIVMGSWTNSGLGTFGGNALQLSTTGQTLMSFTPTTQVDTVEVIALRNNGSVAITIAVDGGATLFTYNPGSGSPVIGTSGAHTLGSLGTHAIQANISVATASFLDGMIAWNSAVKEISVLRAGWQGALTSSFNTSPWFYLDGLKAVAPDLTLIASTRNDVTNATSIATYKSNYQTIINAALISGDVILVIEPMGNLTPTQYAPYVQAVYDLGNVNSLPVIDFTQLWDVYANITTWYADTTHPVGFAYGEMAREIANILMAL
jgi:hypothetical protein